MEEIIEYHCEVCDKKYDYSYNMMKHKKKHHPELFNNNVENDSPFYYCDFCNKEYKHRQSKFKHQKKCVYAEIAAELKLLREKISLLQQQSITNSYNNNCHNTTNNITNNINNYNYYFMLGEEDLEHRLTDEEQIEAIKQQGNCIYYLTNLVHLGEKYPECHNVKITDVNRNKALTYNDKAKGFITVNKKGLLNDLINERTVNILNFMDIQKGKVNPKHVMQTMRYIDNVNNPDDESYNNKCIKDLNLMFYNSKK